LTIAAAETYERLGSPEGELALAQAPCIWHRPKSNGLHRWGRPRGTRKRRGPRPCRCTCGTPHANDEGSRVREEYKYPHDFATASSRRTTSRDARRRKYYEPSEAATRR